MTTLLAFLGLGSLAVLVVGLVALARGRLLWARIRSRRTAAGVTFAAMVVFGVCVAFVPTDDADGGKSDADRSVVAASAMSERPSPLLAPTPGAGDTVTSMPGPAATASLLATSIPQADPDVPAIQGTPTTPATPGPFIGSSAAGPPPATQPPAADVQHLPVGPQARPTTVSTPAKPPARPPAKLAEEPPPAAAQPSPAPVPTPAPATARPVAPTVLPPVASAAPVPPVPVLPTAVPAPPVAADPPRVPEPSVPPPAPPTTADSRAGCDSSYPDVCLRTGIGDYDCEGGEGNGPNYVRGPLRVTPPDPFDLDRDGDGTGCDS